MSDVEVTGGPSGIRTQDRRIKSQWLQIHFGNFGTTFDPGGLGALEGEIQLCLIPNRDAICADL